MYEKGICIGKKHGLHRKVQVVPIGIAVTSIPFLYNLHLRIYTICSSKALSFTGQKERRS